MLLGTIAICNAGFGRWWGPALSHWIGEGYFGAELVVDYPGDFVWLRLSAADAAWPRQAAFCRIRLAPGPPPPYIASIENPPSGSIRRSK